MELVPLLSEMLLENHMLFGAGYAEKMEVAFVEHEHYHFDSLCKLAMQKDSIWTVVWSVTTSLNEEYGR